MAPASRGSEDDMGKRTVLVGKYKRLDETYLRSRAANTDDERHIFYVAMLKYDNYEEYLADVGDIKVHAPTLNFGKTAITGKAEMIYCRTHARIADAKS
jgi:hypothetical protein